MTAKTQVATLRKTAPKIYRVNVRRTGWQRPRSDVLEAIALKRTCALRYALSRRSCPWWQSDCRPVFPLF
jgi:hypothetical protein